MSAILLAPHADDESLFAAYTCIRFRPHIICCTTPKEAERSAEFYAACTVLGCESTIWNLPEGALTADAFRPYLKLLDADRKVYAPAFEIDGHEEHNAVAQAVQSHPFSEVVSYMTYRRGSGRSRGSIAPRESTWPGLKLRAMACYQTQIGNLGMRPWFESDWLEEWLA